MVILKWRQGVGKKNRRVMTVLGLMDGSICSNNCSAPPVEPCLPHPSHDGRLYFCFTALWTQSAAAQVFMVLVHQCQGAELSEVLFLVMSKEQTTLHSLRVKTVATINLRVFSLKLHVSWDWSSDIVYFKNRLCFWKIKLYSRSPYSCIKLNSQGLFKHFSSVNPSDYYLK